METFIKKKLIVTILTPEGKSYRFDHSAIECSITKTGGIEFAKANVKIYGLQLNTLSALTWAIYLKNKMPLFDIIIEAQDGNSSPVQVFKGEILFSCADLNGASPVLKIEAQTGSFHQMQPSPPVSIAGTTPLSDFVAGECSKIGYEFVNEGVTASLKDCTISGSPIEKIRYACSQVGADVLIDDKIVYLIRKSKPRENPGGIPVISAESGMIGYPVLTSTGISCVTYFRPDLALGAMVRVETIVPHCTGVWHITELAHELSVCSASKTAWRTSFNATWTT